MFGFFKKKKHNSDLFAVCEGQFKDISQVNDTVFADKIMGDGYAIKPKGDVAEVYSPLQGEVLSIFPTKHAITFKTNEGVEALIHMGLDTVALKGDGFTIHVEVGDKIDINTHLATMNVAFMQEQGKETDIIIVVTNLEDNKTIEFTSVNNDEVQAKTKVGQVLIK